MTTPTAFPATSFALNQYRFIRAAGPDAKSFLQGQVTCDTSKISTTQSVRGALCNIQGRAIADFRALEIDGDIVLQVSSGLEDKILSILKKYAVFSKVTLTADSALRALGLHIASSADSESLGALLGASLPSPHSSAATLAGGCAIIATELDGQDVRGVELWGNNESLAAAHAKLSELATPGAIEAWIEAENLSGIAHITETMSEEFTPALLNYDISGVVDFKKGCYTGQEIVARMYYRSTPKKRLFALRAETALSAAFGIVESTEDNASRDETLAEAFSIAAHTALAVLPVDAADKSLASTERQPLVVLAPNYAPEDT